MRYCRGFLLVILISTIPGTLTRLMIDISSCKTQNGIIDFSKCILSGTVSTNFQVAQSIRSSVKTIDGFQWIEENNMSANRNITCKQVDPGECSPERSCYYSDVYRGCVLKPTDEGTTATSQVLTTTTALPPSASTTTPGGSVDDCIMVGTSGCIPKDLCEFSFDNQGCILRPEATTPLTETTTTSLRCLQVGAGSCFPKKSCVFSTEYQSCFSNCTLESTGCIPKDICLYSEEEQLCVISHNTTVGPRSKRSATDCTQVGPSGCVPKDTCMFHEVQGCILKPEFTTTTTEETTTTTTVSSTTTELSTTTSGNGCVQTGQSGCLPKDTCLYSFDLQKCILKPEFTTATATTTTEEISTSTEEPTLTSTTEETTTVSSTTAEISTTTSGNGCIQTGSSGCLPKDTCIYSFNLQMCILKPELTTTTITITTTLTTEESTTDESTTEEFTTEESTTEEPTTEETTTTNSTTTETTTTTQLPSTTSGNGCILIGGSGCLPKDSCVYSSDLQMCILKPELTTTTITTAALSSTTTEEISSTSTEAPTTSTVEDTSTTTNSNGCVLIGPSECFPDDTCIYSAEVEACVLQVPTTTNTPTVSLNPEEVATSTDAGLDTGTTEFESSRTSPSSSGVKVGNYLLNVIRYIVSWEK